jgi:NADH:ubiquinone oxidoreductase subunit
MVFGSRLGSMTIGTRIFTLFKGEFVGKDQFGNRYYRERGRRALVKGGGMRSRERRWVIYKGIAEASRVPPEWHGWLHHTVQNPPAPGSGRRYPWQKQHLPNLTGTPYAYRPEGSLLRGGRRAKATGDYEAWTPE